MAKEETLRNVPSDQVGAVVQRFANDGAREIRAIKNTAGSWDVTARFN